MKTLSKKQKTIQIQRELKFLIKHIVEPKIMAEISQKVAKCDDIDNFLESGNEIIKNEIINNHLKM